MADDQELANHVRAALAGTGNVREIKMFGGIGFMLNGNLVAAASRRGLLLRGRRRAIQRNPQPRPERARHRHAHSEDAARRWQWPDQRPQRRQLIDRRYVHRRQVHGRRHHL